MGSEKILSENYEQIIISDLAVQFKSQNPNLKNREARQKAQNVNSEKQIKNCIEHRDSFSRPKLIEAIGAKLAL
jgi:hypothetical protein